MGSDITQQDSPGKRLRAKREEMQIPIDSIADQLHLDTAVIDAIEKDAYEKLPGNIYIKGYLRAYAKILFLDEKQIIQLFNNTKAAHFSPKLKVKRHTFIGEGNQSYNTVYYFTFLGLLALFLVWYQYHSNPEKKAHKAPAPITTSAPAFDYAFNIVTHPPNWQDMAMPIDLGYTATKPENIATVAPVHTKKKGELQLLLSADSWIEVTDTNQNILFFDLGRAGTEIMLYGEPPFTILLGNAADTRLFYNDEAIPLEPNPSNNTARLIVGE